MITKDTLLKDLEPEVLKLVQQALTRNGFSTVADGIYGKDTAKQFAAWKRSIHLGLPEVIGKESWAILSKPAISPDWGNFSSKVSKHFTVGEVSHNSKERIMYHPVHRANALRLAAELDKVREAWGKPIGVTSWYRPEAVNRRIGGARNSQHLNGSAADIYPIGGDIWAFQKWLDKFWGGKALGYGARKGFVHLDLRPGRIRWNY
jgi:putative chitinase